MLDTAMIFILVAALLIVAEVFIPSGGLIAIFSLVCVLIGIDLLFMVDWQYGLTATMLLLVIAPVGLGMFIKFMPYMPVTRLLTLRQRQNPQAVNYDPALENAEAELAGAEGEALTDLRPVGTCLINKKRVECLAATGVIEAGQAVKVVGVNGLEIKVRAV